MGSKYVDLGTRRIAGLCKQWTSLTNFTYMSRPLTLPTSVSAIGEEAGFEMVGMLIGSCYGQHRLSHSYTMQHEEGTVYLTF
jgi:hypothetical protein